MASFRTFTRREGGRIAINLDMVESIMPVSDGTKFVLPEENNLIYVKEPYDEVLMKIVY